MGNDRQYPFQQPICYLLDSCYARHSHFFARIPFQMVSQQAKIIYAHRCNFWPPMLSRWFGFFEKFSDRLRPIWKYLRRQFKVNAPINGIWVFLTLHSIFQIHTKTKVIGCQEGFVKVLIFFLINFSRSKPKCLQILLEQKCG